MCNNKMCNLVITFIQTGHSSSRKSGLCAAFQSALEYLNFAGAVECLGVGTGAEGAQGYHFAADTVSLGV